MRIRTLVAVVSGLVVGAPALEAQNRGLDIIHEAGERYRAVETVCADFEQHLEVPLLNAENTGSGRVCQARPNLFAMRFNDPPGDAVVADGQWVWLYFPSNDDRQVARAPADETAGGEDFHREFLEEPEVKYEVTYEGEDVLRGQPMHLLRLVPRERQKYRSVTLWIDRENPVLRRIRIVEDSGSIRTLLLSDVVFDAEPPAGWFDFTPPDGVAVISG